MKINVLLISRLDHILKALESAISDEEIAVVGVSPGGTDALDRIENLSPDIIVMSYGTGDDDVLSLTERITFSRPRPYVILLAEHLDVETLQSALSAGARNVTGFPKSSKEFCDYIKTVYNNETARIESLNGKQTLCWISKVITVFGAKGGLGKTTLAVNLAVKLAESRKKVALVDLNLQFGDVNVFLDIDPVDTIFELSQELSAPNIDLIRSYMAVHSSGVHVLCAPKSPEYAELVSPEKVQSILGQLRTYYDYVIIDTPPAFSDVTITALELSSVILFVTGLDISILKNSKLSLSILKSLQQIDKVKILVNRAVNIGAITLDDVQRLIECPIWAKIPSDYRVALTALNLGIPFVTGAPKTELSQAVSSLASLLLEGTKDISSLSPKQKKKLGLTGRRNRPGLSGRTI